MRRKFTIAETEALEQILNWHTLSDLLMELSDIFANRASATARFSMEDADRLERASNQLVRFAVDDDVLELQEYARNDL